MDTIFWAVIGFIIVVAILGFVFRTFLKIALVLIVAAILFTIFFGSGEGIVGKAKVFLSDEDGQRVEELYDDFKDRSTGPIDGDALLASINDWVTDTVDSDKMRDDLLRFVGEGLTVENLNHALSLIKGSIDEGEISEELIQFAEETFTKEKAEEFIDMIRGCIE